MCWKLIGAAVLATVASLAAADALTTESVDRLAELVDAEREFARTSVASGMREAFLTFMADDAIVFRPHPVNAKSWYSERPDAPGVLDWVPVFADISLAGDLGYTTGPWEYVVEQSDTPTAYGHYVSVWRKQPDGSWRVVIDLGTVHPRPEPPTPPLTAAGRRRPVRFAEDSATNSASR